MNLLVVQIPPRPRDNAVASTEFDFVLSPDGHAVGSQGRAAAALLPRATRVVAIVADTDIAWHRITLPRAPPARLRAALVGLMEDALLDDEAALHFALAPDAAAGQPSWVAVTHRPWLAGALAVLETAGVELDAARPASLPRASPQGHFTRAALDDAGVEALQLLLSGPDGNSCLSLDGTLPRALAAPWIEAGAATWTATPAAAEAAARWLGAPLSVLTDAERLLRSAHSACELRQFDLAPRHRGLRALRDAAHRLAGPTWRPARIGLVAVAALHLAGVNAWAWQQQRAIDDRRKAVVELLRSAHPQVRAVLDAPLQMERETALLRAAAGQPGPGDLESLLAAAAAAWPVGAGPAPTLRFEPGRLTLSSAGWAEPQRDAFVQRLQGDGWAVEAADGRLTLAAGARR